MTTFKFNPTLNFGVRRGLPLLLMLLVALNLIRWGGAPSVPFIKLALGISVMGILIAIFLVIAWWLFFSPLPAKETPIVRPGTERLLASRLILMAGAFFLVASLWDEIWHRLYGVSAVIKDFLWPPHVLLYTSLILIALIALWGVVIAPFRQGMRGDLRTRFRSDSLLGGLSLLASFQALSLPSDAIWHQIYGLDITAWSLPHLLIISSLATVMFANATVLVGEAQSTPTGRTWWGMRFGEWLALISLACGLTSILQGGTSEWDGLRAINRAQDMMNSYRSAFWQRPEWLFPVIVTVVAVFAGTLALHLIRRRGAASLLGLLVLGFRIAFLTLLGGTQTKVQMSFLPHLILLVVGVGLDLLYTRQGWLGGELTLRQRLVTGLLGSGLGLLVCLPMVRLTMIYPSINASTAPLMLGWGMICGLGGAWLGMKVGNWFRKIVDAQLETIRLPQQLPTPRVNRWSAAILTSAVTIVATFIALARPPI